MSNESRTLFETTCNTYGIKVIERSDLPLDCGIIYNPILNIVVLSNDVKDSDLDLFLSEFVLKGGAAE